MRSIVLAGAVVFSASTCLAQTAAPPQSPTPGIAEQSEDAPVQQTGPANLCQELLAFMTAPVPEPEGVAPAKPAAAAPQQAAPASGTEASGSGTSALAGTTDADEAASAEPDSETNSAQEITKQEGVATDAPDDSGDEKATASGSVEDAPQKDSRSAPTPPADVTSTPKDTVLTVEAAERLAAANDLEQCQKSARQMRVAGVDMPPPLMALAALDLQYQQQSTGANVPAATEEPAAND
ncbi:hypothetical protein [Mesorhizobium sp. CAU 1732]|uniref:hypothetical protein n=1 Tax=Mesorhizobium sp. CAU 1732 TaxID=3140358 RepID=UPI0032606689